MPTFETHVKPLDEDIQRLAYELRSYVLSLGPQVIEEVRPHRVAYAKTMNFRVFLELVPSQGGIELVIRAGRAGPTTNLRLTDPEGLAAAKQKIAWSFEKIQ